MGATTIGLLSEKSFGVSKELNFLVFNADVSTSGEQTVLDTFTGGNICVEHNMSLAINISGATSNSITGNLFSDVFQIEEFGEEGGYTLELGDNFKTPWDIIFENKVGIQFYSYTVSPEQPFLYYGFAFNATAEEVRNVFVSIGHTNATVTRSDTTNRTWTISNLNNYNFSRGTIPRNYPIRWDVLYDNTVPALLIVAQRNSIYPKLVTMVESIESENIMRFSLAFKNYELPITISEKEKMRDVGLLPDALGYFP